MTCKHGFPEPNEMMWQGKKIPRCNECEIERLRQRVAELEDENKRLKLDVDTCSETLKISEQERIRLQKAGHAYRDRMREATTKYKERGERMKAMRNALQKVLDDSDIGVVPRSHLDRIERLLKTGEPL